MFQHGVQGTLYPVAVVIIPEKEISEYDYSDWFYQTSERTFSTEILALGPTVSGEAQLNRISDLSLESIGTVGMAIEEIAGLTDLDWVRTYQH